ncbi:M48 family metallopeptidase [Priestia taiwanensis]|uniref:Metalloprotease n=1 Tax=Priestia taiwanensis TaxID=1347902 RepID=A0A917AV04_9BACI|nr:M48 family metallopeptidase [Priestia taiwanensis]MBM7364231.1 Zn-dependent protease with chaperone function [Priestia taiwanensis]GGE72711.1 metalloprotease [Priestia taiwanensis]
MRRIVNITILLYVLFGVSMYIYFFTGSDIGIPVEYKGTSADPTTFMNARELVLSEEYSSVKNFLFFLGTPFEWIVLFLFMVLGVSSKFEQWAKAITSKRFVQFFIYFFYFSISMFLLIFPFRFVSYQLSKAYHISVQSFSSWMKDMTIDFWVNFIMMFVAMHVLLLLMKKSKRRWWIYAWCMTVPLTLFLTFVQPVLLDPLYHEFRPLQNKQLEERILEMAEKADIPANHVYEVNMSEKTTALNAYVTGIGSNSRIVLWDTTLEKLGENEVLFIMAHEMAHYVKKHIYWGIGLGLGVSLVGFFVVYKLVSFIQRRFGKMMRVEGKGSFAVIPLLLLLFSLFSFVISPFTNYVSRYEERQADTYAIEMTKDNESAVKAFQTLAKTGLNEVDPPMLVKIFRHTHPAIVERILFLESYDGKIDR